MAYNSIQIKRLFINCLCYGAAGENSNPDYNLENLIKTYSYFLKTLLTRVHIRVHRGQFLLVIPVNRSITIGIERKNPMHGYESILSNRRSPEVYSAT